MKHPIRRQCSNSTTNQIPTAVPIPTPIPTPKTKVSPPPPPPPQPQPPQPQPPTSSLIHATTRASTLSGNMSTDILDIHYRILSTLEEETAERDHIQERYTSLCRILQECKSSNSTSTLQREIEVLASQLNEPHDDMDYYLLKATPIINAYKTELKRPVVVPFMDDSAQVVDTTIKDDLIRSYMRIANDYLENAGTEPPIPDDSKICIHCGGSTFQRMDTHSTICTSCGAEHERLEMIYSFPDHDRINITSKYTYDRRTHFRDCINQFQGKQNSTIPDTIYIELKKQFELSGLLDLSSDDPIIRFAQITKKHVYMFLKETGNSKHYEDVNLIYHNITKKPLDDISHLEERLMFDFDLLSDLYDKQYIQEKKIDRKNFINTQYVLYQLLRRHKYDCDRQDFNFLKTTERKSFHDEVCSTLFEKLKWRFKSCF